MNRTSASASSSTLPSLYWHVPGSEKQDRDYIVQNMQHVRNVSSQARKARSKDRLEPIKVKFIPGVTKRNPKYEHVPSRVSGLIRGTRKGGVDPDLPNNSSSKLPVTNGHREDEDFKPIWGASAAANARRIKSTPDIRKSMTSDTTVLRRKTVALKPTDESVYNWRFSDGDNYSQSFTEKEKEINPEKFAKFQNSKDLQLHRVEYVPCDGICADETVFNRSSQGNGDSGSGRSSRGINTDETRIFASTLRPVQSLNQFGQNGYGSSVSAESIGPNSRFVSTVQQQTENVQHHLFPQNHPSTIHDHNRSSEELKRGTIDPFVARIEQNFASMRLNNLNGESQAPIGSQYNQSSTNNINSSSQLMPSHSSQENTGNSPHRIGVVPKYLKKRQQQWKDDEIAKKEAEKTACIPPGHVSMSEPERLETLAKLQNTYDSLVNELNRVPIRIDTIRIRDYKQRLEQELCKLEQAMKLFSRPNVYVKIDQ